MNKDSSRLNRTISIVAGVIVCVGSALTCSGVASAASHPAPPSSDSGSHGGHRWSTNAHGQSYGSDADAQSGDEPILVSTYASNGKDGYVYSKDLYPTIFGGKVSWRQVKDKRTGKAVPGLQVDAPRTLPVYASDGTTEIGTVDLGGESMVTVADASTGLATTYLIDANGNATTEVQTIADYEAGDPITFGDSSQG